MKNNNDTKRTKFSKSLKVDFGNLSKYSQSDDVKNGVAYWGEKNDLPKKIKALSDDSHSTSITSTWHNICLEQIVTYVIGNGLKREDGESMPSFVNTFGESINEVFESIAWDYKELGGCAIEVIWTAESLIDPTVEPQIESIYHLPFGDLRAAEKTYRGTIPGWYVASKWNKGLKRPDPKDSEYIPSYNPLMVTNLGEDGEVVKVWNEDTQETEDRVPQPKQVLVIKRYNSSSDYYPRPDWFSALGDIEIDNDVRKFKRAKMKNDIVMNAIFDIPGDFDDEAYDGIADDIEEHYQGIENPRPFLYNSPGGGDRLNVISPSNAKGNAETYNSYVDDARQRILSAHGVVFGEIVGIDDGKSIFGDQKAEKYQTFLNTTIRKIQMPLLEGLNKLAPYFDLGRMTIDPIDIFLGYERGDNDNPTDSETPEVTDRNQ